MSALGGIVALDGAPIDSEAETQNSRAIAASHLKATLKPWRDETSAWY